MSVSNKFQLKNHACRSQNLEWTVLMTSLTTEKRRNEETMDLHGGCKGAGESIYILVLSYYGIIMCILISLLLYFLVKTAHAVLHIILSTAS